MENSSFYYPSSSKPTPQVTPPKDTFGSTHYGNDSHNGRIPGSSFNTPLYVTNDANPMDADFDTTPLPYLSPPVNDPYNAELQRQRFETQRQLHEARQQLAQVTKERDECIAWNHQVNHHYQQTKTALEQERAMQESRNRRLLKNERARVNQAFSSFVSLTLPANMTLFPSQLDADDEGIVRNCLIGAKLGQGTYGTVIKGTQLKTNKPVAIKMVDRKCDFLNDELNALQRTNHPNIIKLHDALWDDNKCGLVFDLASCDLEAYKAKGNIITVEGLRQVSRAIIKALDHLHSRKIGHMDVKPANILVMCGSSGLVEHNIKLCDLGLAVVAEPHTYGPEANMLKGTRDFFAPEIENDGTYYGCTAADIWSYGASMLDIMGKFPDGWTETYDLFDDPGAIGHKDFQTGIKVLVRELNGVEHNCFAMQFCLYLLRFKPADRPTAAQASRHQWLQDYEPF